MIQYTTTLKNPYYFTTSNVLFKISNIQDNDECGTHLVFYKKLLDKNGQVMKKSVKKGEYYLDKNHNSIKSETNQEVDVYGNELDHEKNVDYQNGWEEKAGAFKYSYFKVTYQTVPDPDDENQNTETFEKYYYLQNMIEIGDSFDNNHFFKRNNNHSSNASADTSYINEFSNSIKEDIKKMVRNGSSKEQIMKNIPNWFFESNVGDSEKTFIVDKKKVIITNVSFADTTNDKLQISDNDLDGLIIDTINEDTVKFANEKLKNISKKLSNETIVTKNNIVNL